MNQAYRPWIMTIGLIGPLAAGCCAYPPTPAAPLAVNPSVPPARIIGARPVPDPPALAVNPPPSPGRPGATGLPPAQLAATVTTPMPPADPSAVPPECLATTAGNSLAVAQAAAANQVVQPFPGTAAGQSAPTMAPSASPITPAGFSPSAPFTPVVSTVPFAPQATPVAMPVVEPPTAQGSPAQADQGHAADYSWVRGRLEYLHVQGGVWKLRYAKLDQDDPYGGSVVLSANDSRLNQFHDGDIVQVEGQVVDNHPDSASLGTRYRPDQITLIHARGDS